MPLEETWSRVKAIAQGKALGLLWKKRGDGVTVSHVDVNAAKEG